MYAHAYCCITLFGVHVLSCIYVMCKSAPRVFITVVILFYENGGRLEGSRQTFTSRRLEQNSTWWQQAVSQAQPTRTLADTEETDMDRRVATTERSSKHVRRQLPTRSNSTPSLVNQPVFAGLRFRARMRNLENGLVHETTPYTVWVTPWTTFCVLLNS